jgi:hypothetical protein
MQNSGEPAQPNRHDGLYKTNSDLRERGAPERFTLETSPYQKAKMHPILTGALAVGAGLGIAVLLNMRKSARTNEALPDNFSEINSFDIREKMEVFGADNVRVGTVDRVEYGEIKLARQDSPDGKHHLIPLDSVEAVDGNKVMLSQTSEQARQMWRTIDEAAASTANDSESNTPTLSKTQGSGK